MGCLLLQLQCCFETLRVPKRTCIRHCGIVIVTAIVTWLGAVGTRTGLVLVRLNTQNVNPDDPVLKIDHLVPIPTPSLVKLSAYCCIPLQGSKVIGDCTVVPSTPGRSDLPTCGGSSEGVSIEWQRIERCLDLQTSAVCAGEHHRVRAVQRLAQGGATGPSWSPLFSWVFLTSETHHHAHLADTMQPGSRRSGGLRAHPS